MQKIIIPVVSKDYFAPQGRISNMAKALARDFSVDVLTISQDVFDDITGKLGNAGNIQVKKLELEYLSLPFSYRDELASIFTRYTSDMTIPGTNLKIWEIAAFDDFWGHISNCSIKGLGNISGDFILLPLMALADHPMDDADVFYTTIASKAKEAGIRLVGYQLYPVFDSLFLMPRLMDAIIVKDDYERQYYEKKGIPGGRIHLLTDAKDRYSLSCIEDAHMNNIYNDQIEVRRGELGVAVINHDKFRPQMKGVFSTLGRAGIPMALFLIKRGFTVRDLSEDEIIGGLYHDDIRKIPGRFYQVENESLAVVVMISDIVISPSFIVPLEFAARYGKKAVVFNPFIDKMPDVNGVVFTRDGEELMSLIQKSYKEKQAVTGMKEILNSISKGK
jgi:hypothetical protein